MPIAAHAQTMHDEMEHHPRIAKAIHELEDAIAYLEESLALLALYINAMKFSGGDVNFLFYSISPPWLCP
jgi:hypothetical protein